MSNILNGKELSAKVREDLRIETEKLFAEHGKRPGLAVIIVGDDPASRIYVNNKKKACAEIGFTSWEYALPAETTEAELLELIKKLNADPEVNGILCQLPLPKHLDEKTVINSIDPKKDVDAFHPVNVGKIMIGDYDYQCFGQEMRGCRPLQHCRQAHVYASSPRKRHRHHLSFPHQGFEG